MDNFLWVEKYRPKTIAECILPAGLKADLEGMVKKGALPNLTFAGTAGVGKTTVAKAVADEMGLDTLVINASMKGNIDTLRVEIQEFASSVSFSGNRKLVILDEADYLNAQSTQPALRNFIEEYSRNCGFILTCNFKGKIIEPLHSRCPIVEFKIPAKEKPSLAMQLHSRACEILSAEGVEHDPAAVAELVKRYFPDFRRVLNELQRYSSRGVIDAGILSKFGQDDMKNLVKAMREKSFTDVRRWVAEVGDVEPAVLFRAMYDGLNGFFTPESRPQVVLLIADYQQKSAVVADQEINTAAFLVHVMSTCTFVE